jgi:hypothetical protein
MQNHWKTCTPSPYATYFRIWRTNKKCNVGYIAVHYNHRVRSERRPTEGYM